MRTLIKQSKRTGLALVEYGMVVALIAIVGMAVVKQTGVKAVSTYDNIQSQMTAQGVDTAAPQTPSDGTASTTSTSSSSNGSGNSGYSGNQGGGHQNNGNHNGQNRN